MSDVEIRLVQLNRDLAVEKKLKLPTLAAVVQIGYAHGAFELTLQVDRWCNSETEMAEEIRKPLVQFAEALKEAALGRIQIPGFPRPQSES